MNQITDSDRSVPEVALRPETRHLAIALLGWVGQTLPTVLVLMLMGGLAYWGHRTEWTFFTRAKHSARTKDEAHRSSELLWADEGELSPALFSWCSEHGVSGCPVCRSEAAQLAKPPTFTAADGDRIRKAFAVRGRATNDPAYLGVPPGRPRAIRFASGEAVEKGGIDIAPAWQTTATETVNGSGEITFDPTRVARLSARLPGTAWWVAKKLGDPVKSGDVMALIDAADLGKGKIELQQALVQVRLKAKAAANLKNSPAPERQKREADAALKDAEVRLAGAEQALVNLGLPVRYADFQKLTLEAVSEHLQSVGLPEDIVRSFGAASLPATLLPVRASFDGVVMQADVIAGEVVDAAKVLFVIADPRRLWLTLHVSPEDARWLKVGQSVRFRADGGSTEVMGRVNWIGKSEDEKTRTVPVRADLANEDGQLRAFTFGVGKVVLREEPQAIVVPAEAVHAEGGCQIVFVRDKDFLKTDGPKVFYPRAVRIGAKDGGNTEIIVGLLPGEVVATKGSRLLLDELRKAHVAQGVKPSR